MIPSELVKVKALEWEYGLARPFWEGKDGWHYFVWHNGSLWEATYENDFIEGISYLGYLPTEAEAKAACQAHYESMVLSLLEVK